MSGYSSPVLLQSFDRSRVDCAKLLSLDRESIDAPTSPLIHQEARFLYILKGRGEISIQGRQIELRPDTLLSILPWQISEVTSVTDPLQYYLMIYDIEVFNRFIQSFRDIDDESAHWIAHLESQPALYCSEKQSASLLSYFTSLREEIGLESTLELIRPKPLGTLWVMNRAMELIIMAERFRVENCAGVGASASPAEDADMTRNELLRYMYLHTGEKLAIGNLAQIFRMSERSIRAYLKGTTGMSFYELLNEMRIGKISGYLLYTDLTLGEISFIFGYTDISHLSKIFTAMTGMRINDYRKAYQSVKNICHFERAELAYSIVQYIYRHYHEPLTINELARQFGLSAHEVNRLLVVQAEKNFSEYLNFIRINKACQLMLSTGHTMTYISVEVGYTSVKTFNRNFLRLKGMSPSDFRKSVSLQDAILAHQEE